jgi:hypothetical protein
MAFCLFDCQCQRVPALICSKLDICPVINSISHMDYTGTLNLDCMIQCNVVYNMQLLRAIILLHYDNFCLTRAL